MLSEISLRVFASKTSGSKSSEQSTMILLGVSKIILPFIKSTLLLRAKRDNFVVSFFMKLPPFTFFEYAISRSKTQKADLGFKEKALNYSIKVGFWQECKGLLFYLKMLNLIGNLIRKQKTCQKIT